jgi:hypothetical protein
MTWTSFQIVNARNTPDPPTALPAMPQPSRRKPNIVMRLIPFEKGVVSAIIERTGAARTKRSSPLRSIIVTNARP